VDLERRRAAEAEARAEIARGEAERAEQRAAEARQGMHVEEARQEDVLRKADALDPDVDHRADGYQPGSTGSREI
jgi:septal ring factor EnvC (AmiA/AmiB activator)